MPSSLFGQNVTSGAQQIVSGNPFSGNTGLPIGGIQLRWDPLASGLAYVGYSGGPTGVTINSGGFFLSGGGLSDGVPLAPGDTYFIPMVKLPYAHTSGTFNIYFRADVACSGQARMYWDTM